MQKIKSLFHREYKGDRMVYNEVVHGSEWVQNGEGVVTRKWDGTSCMAKRGRLFKRYDAKQGKTPPDGFVPAQEPDELTGHWPGWLPVFSDAPSDKWHLEALAAIGATPTDCKLADGTYELVGPKVCSNRDKQAHHHFVAHGADVLTGVPTDFEGLKAWMQAIEFEGVVWHHPDGRMVKAKRRDFWKS